MWENVSCSFPTRCMAISARPQLPPKYCQNLALWLPIIPLPHTSTAERLPQGDQTSPAACRPLGYPRCFKATRAMVSTLFVVQTVFWREKKRQTFQEVELGLTWEFPPNHWKKVKTLRVYGLRVFKIFQRSLRRLERNWLFFVKLEDTWERAGFSDWCFKLKMWEWDQIEQLHPWKEILCRCWIMSVNQECEAARRKSGSGVCW